MPSYSATGQPDPNVPNGHVREHCTANAGDLSTIGCGNGQQVRIERWEGGVKKDFALYTIKMNNAAQGFVQVGFKAPENVNQDLKKRLGLTAMDPFTAMVNSQVAAPNLSDDDAKTQSEFVERLQDDGNQTAMIAIAPHGGMIEQYTDAQAEEVYAKLKQNSKCASKWLCKGWKQSGGASDRWHITATDINPNSFPELNKVVNRNFTYAVAFHGWVYGFIGIGGKASSQLKTDIKTAIVTAINDPSITVATDDDPAFSGYFPPGEATKFNGTSPQNIVNRLSLTGGVHIEQSLIARKNHWTAIADAVASVLNPLLPVCLATVGGKALYGVAVDPISLILDNELYVQLKTLPDPPPPGVLAAQVRQRVRTMGREEKRLALARVRGFLAYARALEQELTEG
jgi:phage replication-related protein YjqB (UPF0714/DUF867 family)